MSPILTEDVCVCVCVFLSMLISEKARLCPCICKPGIKVGYFPQFLSTLVLRQELSLILELKDSTRQKGSQFLVFSSLHFTRAQLQGLPYSFTILCGCRRSNSCHHVYTASIVTSRPLPHPLFLVIQPCHSIHISTNHFLTCLYYFQIALSQMSTFHTDPFYYSLILLILYLFEWSLCFASSR